MPLLDHFDGWAVRLDKHASIWSYYTKNPQGGGFGSSGNSGAPQRSALAKALRSVPAGASYRLIVNGNDRGERIKLA